MSRWGRDPGVEDFIAYFDEERFFNKKLGSKGGYDYNLLSPKEYAAIEQEVLRCRENFEYAARNYFFIRNEDRQDQLFRLWESQELILDKIYMLRDQGWAQKLLILKARRLGCSTLIEAMVAWKTFFFENVNSLIISYASGHAATLLGMTLNIYHKLPWWMKAPYSSLKYEEGIVLENPDVEQRRFDPGLGSKIMADEATSLNVAGVGDRITCAHFSEISRWQEDRAQQIIESDVGPAISKGPDGFAVIESTAKGAGTYYDELWRRSTDKGEFAEYYPMFLPFFFLRTNVMAPPQGWKAPEKEEDIRKKVARTWCRCDNPECRQYVEMMYRGESRQGTTCTFCKTGTYESFLLADDQLFWLWRQHYNAQGDDKAMKNVQQEYACVGGNMLVSTDRGLMPIRDAVTSLATRVETGEVSVWADNGTRDVVAVRTALGREMIVTPDHRILLEGGEWRAAGELKAGDRVVLSPPVFATETHVKSWEYAPCCTMSVQIDREFGRLLGYFMGDGCWRGSGINFACDLQDGDVIEDISALCESRIGSRSTTKKKGEGCLYVESHNKKWFDIMWNLGALEKWADNTSGYKRKVCVPDAILRSPREVVAGFLSCLFESDGHVCRRSGRIIFASKHTGFIRTIQLLLLGFGINSRISIQYHGKSGDGHKYTTNVLTINKLAAKIFHDEIGFVSERKRSRRNGMKTSRPGNFRGKLSANEMVDAVLSVEPAGEADVYDLTVPGPHRFGANGVMVHNCTPETAFAVSGRCVFPQQAQDFAAACVADPIARVTFDTAGAYHGYNGKTGKCYQPWCKMNHGFDDAITEIWEWPRQGAKYYMFIDPSGGGGGDADYYVIWVNRVGHDADVQVAMLRCNDISGVEVAHYANAIGRMYNMAIIAVEVNKHTTAFDTLRFKHLYPNLYRQKNLTTLGSIQSSKLGWETTPKTKERMIQMGVTYLRTRCFIVRSRVFVREMKTFVADGDSMSARASSKRFKDDTVMAALGCVYIAHDTDFREDLGDLLLKSKGGEQPQKDTPFLVICARCKHREGSDGPPDPMAPGSGQHRCSSCGSPFISFKRKQEQVFTLDGAAAARQNGPSPASSFEEL